MDWDKFLIILFVFQLCNRISSEDNSQVFRKLNVVQINNHLPVKYLWVDKNGKIIHQSGREPQIVISATITTTYKAHYKAAILVSLMTSNMPKEIFRRLAELNSSVGVFAANESLSIWPQYSHAKDTPECKDICSGYCSKTCINGGRKVDSLIGLASKMAAIREDNILCSFKEPYHHHENILLHEFAHTINFLLPAALKQRVTNAYEHAKKNKLWDMESYAMSNSLEYFAEASTSYFMVTLRSKAGGMNRCGLNYCKTEMDARNHIKEVDPQLFAILTYIYTNKNPRLPSYLKICI